MTHKTFAKPRPPALGSHPLDRLPSKDSPALRYIFAALKNPEQCVQSLFRISPSDFRFAPDPSPQLHAAHQKNQNFRTLRGPQLSVLTYNLALLDIRVSLKDVLQHLPKLSGAYPYLLPFRGWSSKLTIRHPKSPYISARLKLLAQHLFTPGDDILFLQEIWSPTDAHFLKSEAKRFGYVAITCGQKTSHDGLMTLVHKNLMKQGQVQSTFSKIYERREWRENFADIARGYHYIQVTSSTLGTLHLFNTHLQAFPEHWRIRLHQVRELALAVSMCQLKYPEDIIILAGDLNSAPYYHNDSWHGDDLDLDGFWANAIAYPLLQHYSALDDAVVMGRPFSDVDADVSLAKNYPLRGTKPRYPFSASARANLLYRMQYGESEPPARLDAIRINSDCKRIFVEDAQMCFSEDYDSEFGKIPLSDHFGFRAKLRIKTKN